jgi:plastocyanin
MTDQTSRRRLLALGGTALATTLAGCGGDGGSDGGDGGDGGGDGDDSDDATPTPTPTDDSTPEPAQRVVVAPEGQLRFDPETFSIAAGDTVLWEWDGGGHNVSPGSQPSDADWSGDDEELYSSGHTYTYTFEVTGEYEYHCDPHQGSGMVGSFTVE